MTPDSHILNDPIAAVRSFVTFLLKSQRGCDGYFQIPKPEGLLLNQAPGHFHTTPELFFQFSGELNFIFPFERMTLNTGNICVVPKGLPHDESIKKTNESFFQAVVSLFHNNASIHIASGKTNKHPVFYGRGVVISWPGLRKLQVYLDDYVEMKYSSSIAQKYCSEGISKMVLGFLLELMDTDVAVEKINHKIIRCQQYIERDFSNPLLSVKFLAEKLNCTPDYLSYLFHKETGQTINKLIIQYRLDHATMLLHEPALNISEIARHCGFQDPGYFTRIFKTVIGVTPRRYRQNI